MCLLIKIMKLAKLRNFSSWIVEVAITQKFLVPIEEHESVCALGNQSFSPCLPPVFRGVDYLTHSARFVLDVAPSMRRNGQW